MPLRAAPAGPVETVAPARHCLNVSGPPGIVRQSLPDPLDGKVESLVEDYVARAAISPDGKYVAYVDQMGLYLRSVDSGETRALSVPTELRSRIWGIPWFPEGGKLLAVTASSEGNDLWVITILGVAPPRLLYRHGESPAFSPDGRLIAFISGEFGKREREVLIGDISGGTARIFVKEEENQWVHSPAWSPDGRWIAYLRDWRPAQGSWTSAIEVRPTEGGPASALLSESSLPKSSFFDCATSCFAWSPDWRLVFPVSQASESPMTDATHGLWAIHVEPQKAKAAGKPERLVQTGFFVPGDLTITADGKRLSFRKELAWDDVYLGELGPDGTSMKLPRRLTLDNRGSTPSDWTRDSQAILFASKRSGRFEVFRQGLKETAPEALVEGSGANYDAVISPDGSWLLYRESPAATLNARPSLVRLMRRPVGGGPPEVVLEEHGDAQWDFVCPGKPGSSCVLQQQEGKDYVFYWLDTLRQRPAAWENRGLLRHGLEHFTRWFTTGLG